MAFAGPHSPLAQSGKGTITVWRSSQTKRGKAKYLIGIILDPVLLAVFKFWFHEIFVVTKNTTVENEQFHEIFASTIINNKLIYSLFLYKNCTTGVIFDLVLPPKAASI